MKSTIYSGLIKLAAAVTGIFAAAPVACACGPYNPIIPTPVYFNSANKGKARNDFNNDENLLLWQRLTSPDIPLGDIARAVYKADIRELDNHSRDNAFLNYLHNTDDYEALEFLHLAKTVQRLREQHSDAWYYPSRPGEAQDAFADVLQRLKEYKGDRLRDRYALQAVRAYFASGRFGDCIQYYDSAFRHIPADNLFRRMADGYVAGCWMHLGDTLRANDYFLKAGDLQSLRTDNPELTMARYNPDCPELLEKLQRCAGDSAKFARLLPVAEAALKNPKLKNRGDWEFFMAYLNGNFLGNTDKADEYIRRALGHRFSSADLRDHARAYRMLADARKGDESHLADDLRWIEGKMRAEQPDAYEWNRMLKNVVFTGWVPQLWQKEQYAKAILLCGYADNYYASHQRHYNWRTGLSYSLDQLRRSPDLYNPLDYSDLTFQLMGSLSSDQLIRAKKEFEADDTLYGFLRRYARTDGDYINELIGTLALREENYGRAADYLAKVSPEYLECMNIYKDSCIGRNPFDESPQKSVMSSSNAKLDFARGMQKLKKQMEHGRTADERGLAALRYAIGRRNSFEDCWALTQYWRGFINNRFTPDLQYRDDKPYQPLAFLYEHKDHDAVQARYRHDVEHALASLDSDEASAEAQLILGNLRTIVRRYGDTAVAGRVKSSCDRWRQWL